VTPPETTPRPRLDGPARAVFALTVLAVATWIALYAIVSIQEEGDQVGVTALSQAVEWAFQRTGVEWLLALVSMAAGAGLVTLALVTAQRALSGRPGWLGVWLALLVLVADGLVVALVGRLKDDLQVQPNLALVVATAVLALALAAVTAWAGRTHRA